MNHRDADEIRPGLRRTDAIEAFESSCCRPGQTLWITESWFAPRRLRLEETLSEVITEDEASALNDAVHQRHPVDFVIAWLETQPRPAWSEFAQQHEADLRASELADMRRRISSLNGGSGNPRSIRETKTQKNFCRVSSGRARLPTGARRVFGWRDASRPRHVRNAGATRARSSGTFVDLVSPFDGVSVDRGWLALCHPCRVIAVEMFPRPEIAWFGLGNSRHPIPAATTRPHGRRSFNAVDPEGRQGWPAEQAEWVRTPRRNTGQSPAASSNTVSRKRSSDPPRVRHCHWRTQGGSPMSSAADRRSGCRATCSRWAADVTPGSRPAARPRPYATASDA